MPLILPIWKKPKDDGSPSAPSAVEGARDFLEDGQGLGAFAPTGRTHGVNYNAPGYEERRDRLNGLLDNRRRGSYFRGEQDRLIGQMQDRAAGRNLISTGMLADAARRNSAAQRGLLAGADMDQQGAATRLAAKQSSNIAQGLAGQQDLAARQEMAKAQSVLANMLSQARSQDNALTTGLIDEEMANAEMDQRGRISQGRHLAGLPSFGEKVLDGLSSAAAGYEPKSYNPYDDLRTNQGATLNYGDPQKLKGVLNAP